MFRSLVIFALVAVFSQGCCSSKIVRKPIPNSPAKHMDSGIRKFGHGTIVEEQQKVCRETFVYAQLASNAYSDSAKYEIPGLKELGRYSDKCTGFSADVYEVTDGPKRFIVAFRGTDDIVKDNVYANLSLGWRGQYKNAGKLIKMVRQMDPNAPITATGHSLGGGLALHSSLKYPNVEAFAFLTSPRVFADNKYKLNNSRRVIIEEQDQALRAAPEGALRKFSKELYVYNFLKGNYFAQHGSYAFSRAMTGYAASIGDEKAIASMKLNGLDK